MTYYEYEILGTMFKYYEYEILGVVFKYKGTFLNS